MGLALHAADGQAGDEVALEDEEEDDESGSATFESENRLLDLLTRVRQQLIDGDYRALYAVWEVYGWNEEEEDEEETPPRPSDKKRGKDVVDEFRALLATQ